MYSYDVSCIIGNYIKTCVKSLEKVSLSNSGGRIPVSFQYLKKKLSHGRYLGFPLPLSLRTLLLTCDTKRAAADRRVQDPVLELDNGGTDGRFNLGTGRGDGGGIPVQIWIPADGSPEPNLRPIQRLRLLPGKNMREMCQNIALPILGGDSFFNRWHMGFACFAECPRKGYHVHSLAVLIYDVD